MFDFDLDVTAENVLVNLNNMAHDPARDATKFRKWASEKLGITVVESIKMKTAAPKPEPKPARKTVASTVFSRKKSAAKPPNPKKSHD